MYRVDRNNFYKNEKLATVYTPMEVSNWLFKILENKISKDGIIFDPCVGGGSLLRPWLNNNWEVLGVDIELQGFKNTWKKNYLAIKVSDLKKFKIKKPSLVIMNPPFNIDSKTKRYIKKKYGGRPLLPEIWFKKAIELFGEDIPIVMFTPYGFRLNLTIKSKRWDNFISKKYPSIKSIVSLPKNIFEGILFHSEILIFNIEGLKGHYFLGEI